MRAAPPTHLPHPPPPPRLPLQVVLVPYSLTKAQRESALPFALADAQRALPSVRCVISEAIGVGDLVVQMIDNRVQAGVCACVCLVVVGGGGQQGMEAVSSRGRLCR